MNRPEIPVGGRLRFFLDKWEEITNDQWVLSVIREGYKLEFLQAPPFSGVKQTLVSLDQETFIQKEIDTLLEKDCIEVVPQQFSQEGFYSIFFLVTKKNGKLRPVINLRPLNRYLETKHFKMETLAKVINMVKPNDWAISLDLSDAYLHILFFPKHRKFLRFCVKGICYQWKVLCFGPKSAPRVFTKMTAVVAAHLRSQNIRLTTYLDDWFALNQLRKMLVQDRDTCLCLLVALGFIVNLEKSNLVPTQSITYIGGLFLLDQSLVLPTPERVQKLQNALQILSRGQNTAKDFLHLLGLMASCIELIPNARLFMRPIQLHLLAFWRPSSQDLGVQIPVTPMLKSHLVWWSQTANITKGRSTLPNITSVTITTDASKQGYGGYMGKKFCQGVWSPEQKKKHINWLEMEAVFLTLKHFKADLANNAVQIRCDNTTVVQYLNKQGGTRSPQLCYKTWDLWNLAVRFNMTLKAAHIAGKQNILADSLSRHRIRPTEWSLNRTVVQTIFHRWGYPVIDLFASAVNKQTQVFCSWIPHPEALALDALTISWENMFAFVFPPLCLVPKVLRHMSQFKCQIILIAPLWPRRNWYTELLQFLIDSPLKLPESPDLLHQANNTIWHPNPAVFKLHAWFLSTETSKIKDFLNRLEPYSQLRGGKVLKKTTPVNLGDSVAGVVQGKLIPILPL